MDKSLSKKVMVITGATSGIGLAAATELAGRGALVIGVGRSEKRCSQAREGILSKYPDARIEYLIADLSLQKHVRELAAAIKNRIEKEEKKTIDVLINNAGTVVNWYTVTSEGFELQFAVNHLAPFLLTHELMPAMSSSGRVIMTSSGSHYRTRMNWKDIQLRRHYNCLMMYKQCKLANVLFAAELNRRLKNKSNIRAYAVDPGLVNTDIGLKGTYGIVRFVWKIRSRKGIEPKEAAKTMVFLASLPPSENPNDVYWKECKPKEPSRYSMREDVSKRLWEISEKMCGIRSEDFGL
jgi:NAD(P)-dependent dehydrogenase (short-subunit alcohol dehydrogenase family)